MSERRPVVVIDPGHGGTAEVGGSRPDSHPSFNGLHEKNLTLDLARRVSALLASHAQVILTRNSDVNLGLAARAQVARDNQADIFVSIHFNAAPGQPAVNGTVSFVVPGASQRSRALAQALTGAIASAAQINNRGVRENNWGVIRADRHAPGTAATLLEVSFLTNQAEAQRLAQDSYLQSLAVAIAGAIRSQLAAAPAAAPPQQQTQAYNFGWGMGDSLAIGLSLPTASNQPLDPGAGGRAIDALALQPADLVIKNGSDPARPGPGSAWAAIHVGQGMLALIEAGIVEIKSVKDIALNAVYLTVLRHPEMTPAEAERAAEWARAQAGSSMTYRGIMRGLQCRLDPVSWCGAREGTEREQCMSWRGLVNLGSATNDDFSCSQLVLGAYDQAGKPLTAVQPNWDTAADLALQLAIPLGYVGHLKAPGATTQSLEVPWGWASEGGGTSSRIRFLLQSSVGRGATNNASDVTALKNRLHELGFDWLPSGSTMDSDTIAAIKLFQGIVDGNQVLTLSDGRVDVPGPTYRWLQDINAPRWQTMPSGSQAEGFYNAELADTRDQHDYGTNWLRRVIVDVSARYRDTHLSSNPGAALLTLNDTSLPRGGRTTDHSGHQTGLAADLRLPRQDGRAGGITWSDTSNYDQAATRAQLEALRDHPQVSVVYFNDPALVSAGLCRSFREHDNHIHFQIRPEDQRGIQLFDTPAPGDTAVAGLEWARPFEQDSLLDPAPVDDERFAGIDQAASYALAVGDVMTVVDSDARIRIGPPDFEWDRPRRIPRYTRIRILEEQGDYARVEGVDGTAYGWTAASNLGTYFKDNTTLQSASLAPSSAVTVDSGWPSQRRALANTYNRIGGLIDAIAGQLSIESAGVLAVWYVESAGRSHTTNQAIIRFENHLLWRRWGSANTSDFDQHFQYGTRAPQTGASCNRAWKCHRFRAGTTGNFQSFHGNQTLEYEVLALATSLAGENIALQCISMGGPQILGSNHRNLGYSSPRQMYDAFQAGERAHVLGFFDYCQYHGTRNHLIEALRTRNWRTFARGYNGSGKEEQYGNAIQNAYSQANHFLGSGTAQALEQGGNPYERAIRHYGGNVVNPSSYANTVEGFQEYLTAVGITHFSAEEMTRPHHRDIARDAGYTVFLPSQDWWPRGAVLGLIADHIRNMLNEPVTMRNWWRPEPYNANVQGAPGSDHVTAHAVDLDYRSSDSRQRAETWLRTQYNTLSWLNMSLGLGSQTTHIGVLSPQGHRDWYYRGHPNYQSSSSHQLAVGQSAANGYAYL